MKKVDSLEDLYRQADFLSLHIPATEQTRGSIGYELLMSMPKGATLVNTARKEVIDEQGVVRALTEREDLKYITDIAAGNQAELDEKFGKRVFATAKKMGPRPPRPISTRVWPQPPKSSIFSGTAIRGSR